MQIIKLLIGVMLMISTGFAFASSYYTIKSGDTLTAIAIAHQTSVARLMGINPSVTNPDKIFAGRTLVVSPVATPSVVRLSPAPVLPKLEVQKAVENVSTCAPLRAIERFGYPKAVAESFIAMVKADLESEVATDQEHHYVIESAEMRYSFTYSERCTFAKSESNTNPLVAAVELPDSTGPPTSLATREPNTATLAGTHLRNIGQGEATESPRQALKRFLVDAIGPPYDVEPILETMTMRAQLSQWGLKIN